MRLQLAQTSLMTIFQKYTSTTLASVKFTHTLDYVSISEICGHNVQTFQSVIS